MSLAIEARKFLRYTQRGILSTHSAKFADYPFGSVAPFIVDHHGAPVVLISAIAEHTKNIIQNSKVSLIAFSDESDLQANARLTLLGEAVVCDKSDQHLRNRYLRYFPQAESYFDTHDFAFYRIHIKHARYIAGFGNMGWLEGSALNTQNNAEHFALIEQETEIIEHMNADHQASMLAYCQHFHNVAGTHATMLGIDCDGFDVKLKLANSEKNQTLRFTFSAPINDALSARKALVDMSKLALKN